MMNMETLVTCPVDRSALGVDQLEALLERHLEETGSRKAADILQHWDIEQAQLSCKFAPKKCWCICLHPLTQ